MRSLVGGYIKKKKIIIKNGRVQMKTKAQEVDVFFLKEVSEVTLGVFAEASMYHERTVEDVSPKLTK